MNQDWEADMGDILPDLSQIDRILQKLLPGEKVSTMDLIEDVLKGNWVLEPKLFLHYIQSGLNGYWEDLRQLLISLLVLFIMSAVITSFLNAFQNTGAAKAARFFFILCQLVVLITALKEVMGIVTEAFEQMLDFLKLVIPAYMICVAAAGSGLSAVIFYKLLLGILCLIEGIVVAGLMPVVEGYILLGVVESLHGEERFKGLMDLIKKGILWTLKGLIVIITGSGILQTIITPVIDKANLTMMQKTAGAIPGIGDIAESIANVTIVSASAVKNSFGVVILLLLILLMTAPVLRIFLILGAVRLGTALGSIAGEKQMTVCSEYMTDAGFLMLRMLVTVTALFFLTIAALTNATSI